MRTLTFVCVSALLFALVAATSPSSGCSGTPAWAPGSRTTVTIDRPEGQRFFILYVPQSYRATPAAPAPLQVLFHGLNDNCENFINATGFIPYAEQDSYVLVSACGSIGLLGIAWNSGTCCGFLNESYPNDMELSRLIVANVSAGLCIDSDRVVATGFSNGAFMSQVNGCVSPDIFRGAASVSGVVELRPGNEGALQACTANISMSAKRPAVLDVHGTFDVLVPYATGDPLLGFPPVPENMAAWVTRNNCSATPITTINETFYYNQIWNGCTSGWSGSPTASVELVTHIDGTHQWPIDKEFDTTTYIHSWMKRIGALN